MKYYKVLLIAITILLIVMSCDKDPIKNPCDCGQQPVSANFTITETRAWPSWLMEKFEPYDTDTLMFGSAVFTAFEDDAKYTWLIGTETLHDKEVKRSNFPSGQTVPITLIVEKTPDNECFPNDDGRDTLIRYLYQAESPCESLINGNYHGVLESNQQDTFTVYIDNCPPYPDINGNGIPSNNLVIVNLKQGCTFEVQDIVRSYKQVVSWGPGCDAPVSKITVSDENYSDIEIQFMFQAGDNKDKEFIFKGTKI